MADALRKIVKSSRASPSPTQADNRVRRRVKRKLKIKNGPDWAHTCAKLDQCFANYGEVPWDSDRYKRTTNALIETTEDQDRISGNGIAPTKYYRAGGFTTTHWSVVLEAQGPTPVARAALEKLCRTYWRPVYGFVRRESTEPEEAKDLTQGFFALLLERRDLDTVRQERGRLRSYLLTSLKHFLINEHQRAMAIKRGEGQHLISLDQLRDREHLRFEPVDTSTADQIYERRWALALLDQILTRLEDEYRLAGNVILFEHLKALLTDEPGRPSQAQIAAELGMTENAVKQAFHRLRERYRQLLREEIAHTVMAPGDIEDELRHLVAVLSV
jgi:RNA polymerase sigma factor (sigma-70 family)